MTKICSKCKVEKSLEHFYWLNKIKGTKQSYCKNCSNECAKNHQKINGRKRSPESNRASVIKWRYGLSLEDYELILKNQDHSCAGCKRHVSTFDKNLSIDHNHLCCSGQETCGNCVRGILCHACNLILGYAQDDRQRLLNLIAYLDNLDVKKN